MSVALVVGSAECLWDDSEKALRLFTPDAYFVINDSIPVWPLRVDYACSLHIDKMPNWINRRREKNGNDDFEIWSHRPNKQPIKDRTVKATPDLQGSSSLFAVKVAIMQLQFDAAVLVGIPLEANAGHIIRHKPWNSVRMFYKGWEKQFDVLKNKVRSPSGWTKNKFGEPTEEWLKEKKALDPNQELIAKINAMRVGENARIAS